MPNPRSDFVRVKSAADPTNAIAAQARWENEGGASRRVPPVKAQPAAEPVPTPGEAAAVDALQDELMTAESSEGRPPPRTWRLAGTTWLLIFVPVLLVAGGLVWVATAAGMGTAVAVLVVLFVMVAAAVPVWGSGLLRGSEERATRNEAKAEVLSRRGE